MDASGREGDETGGWRAVLIVVEQACVCVRYACDRFRWNIACRVLVFSVVFLVIFREVEVSAFYGFVIVVDPVEFSAEFRLREAVEEEVSGFFQDVPPGDAPFLGNCFRGVFE